MTSARQLLIKTLPYILAKIALGCTAIGISVLALLLWGKLGFDSDIFLPAFLIWAIFSASIGLLVMHYFSQRLRAGHIAVVAEGAGANRIPPRQLNWGKRHVKQMYPVADKYHSMQKLISRSIREVQSGFGSDDIKSSFLPDMLAIPGITQMFVFIFLKHIDKACMGYLFLKRKGDKYKNAADAIVVYGQNRKVLLNSASKVLIKSAIYTCAAIVVAFLPLGMLFRFVGWPSLVALGLSVLVGWVAKFSLLDSYIMIRTTINFTKIARHADISEELYDRFLRMSPSLQKILKKAQTIKH